MSKPNILIVMTDHQRADTVLPEHGAITPNLDKLVSQGVAFTQTYCPTPHCCPSRATFMSGEYPSRHGVWNNVCNAQALSRGLNQGIRLWSEDLRDAGYDLHYMGKWHVSAEEGPVDRGWKEYNIGANKGQHASMGCAWEKYKELAREPEKTERGPGEILRPGWGDRILYGTSEGNQFDELSTENAGRAMTEVLAGGKPWCLYVGFNGPHDPYCVPQKYIDMYNLEDIPLPASYADEMAEKPMVYKRMREQVYGQLSEMEVRDAIRHFWAYCTYLDDLFGQILEQLDKSGQTENTLVLYTSDHGDYCGDHGLFAKGVPCFEGAYHVPAVIRWPQMIKNPGRRVDDFVSLADFGPTFMEAAGLRPSTEIAGRSLVPFLRAEQPSGWRQEICTQLNGVELYYTQRSIRTKQWHYTFNGFDQDELYDLVNDPHQLKNLANDKAHEETKRKMVGRMWRCMYELGDAAMSSYITVGLAPYGPAEAFR